MSPCWMALLVLVGGAGDCVLREVKGTLYLDSPEKPGLPQAKLEPSATDPDAIDEGTMHADRDDYRLELGQGRYLLLGWGSAGGGRQHQSATIVGADGRGQSLFFESPRAEGRL